MIVVSDTSPLTNLAQIQRFALLQSLFGEVVIPPAVERELKAGTRLHEGLDWTVMLVVEPKSSEATTFRIRPEVLQRVLRLAGEAED